jgi:hypothetical protein
VSNATSANAANRPGGYSGKPWPGSPLRRSPSSQWSPPFCWLLHGALPPRDRRASYPPQQLPALLLAAACTLEQEQAT